MAFKELSFEDRTLGGSAEDAIKYIRKIEDEEQLNILHLHEKNGMNRKSVISAILRRLNRINKSSKY